MGKNCPACHANSDPYGDGHDHNDCDPDPHRDVHRNPNAYHNKHNDLDPYAQSHPQWHWDRYADPDSHPNTHRDVHTDTHSDRGFDPDRSAHGPRTAPAGGRKEFFSLKSIRVQGDMPRTLVRCKR